MSCEFILSEGKSTYYLCLMQGGLVHFWLIVKVWCKFGNDVVCGEVSRHSLGQVCEFLVIV